MHGILSQIDDGSLRPGQKPVMSDLYDFFVSHDKGYVAMPTGSGKTVMFGALLASHNIKSLVVVPTRQLINQTIHELVSQGAGQVIEAVNTTSRSNKLLYENSQVVVTTYAQLVKSCRNPWGKNTINPQDYGMVILDEAHHALADGASQALRSFDHAFQIGFTATPDYSEARKLSSRLPSVIHELTISEAIAADLITPYVNGILLTSSDMSGVPIVRNEFDSRRLDVALNTHARNREIARFFVTELADKKSIFSCNSVSHAESLAIELQSQGVAAAAIHGGLPRRIQEELLYKFKQGQITALCNNKILAEGFDDTSIEVVVNASPTLSLVRHQQRTGRGLRLDKNNPDKELLIIDCLDSNYRRKPVMFFDEEIAGSTGIPFAATPTLETMKRLKNYNDNGVTFLGEESDIYEYIKGLERKVPNHKEEAEPKTGIRKGSIAVVGHMVIDGVLQRSSKRRYEIGNHKSMAEIRSDGLCAQTDPEAFFPEKGGSTREAKRVCAQCEIKEDCLEISLLQGERFGIWGGLSERDRRKLSSAVISFSV